MPDSLVSLIERGVVEDVVRPLMSGKEAQVYLVMVHGEQHVAKVYKEANDRTFKHRSDYLEGRQVRNTRDRRAIQRGSQYGRSQQEAAWRAVEADVIYRLRDAGVHVPEPKAYIDNVLVMELVVDERGNPAPRLADLTLNATQAAELFESLLRDVVRMLCAGLVHGDLSEFNVLLGTKGPVIIDFPQATDAAKNRNARRFLLRDVGNLTRFFGRTCRGLRSLRYAEEMWDLYERGQLLPDTPLTGRFRRQGKSCDASSLLAEIEEIEQENRVRRQALGLAPSRPARQPRIRSEEPQTPTEAKPSRSRRSRSRRPAAKKPAATGTGRDASQRQPNPSRKAADPAKPKRRRRRRRKPGGAKPPRS